MLRTLALVFALAAAAPAQFSSTPYNFSTFGAWSWISWDGAPALVIVSPGAEVGRFSDPRWGAEVQLDILATMLIDPRPCAVGGALSLAPATLHFPAPYNPRWLMPASGMIFDIGYHQRMKYRGDLQPGATRYSWSYCGTMGCRTFQCSPTEPAPLWNAVVCRLVFP